jgi:hypothetical protein
MLETNESKTTLYLLCMAQKKYIFRFFFCYHYALLHVYVS